MATEIWIISQVVIDVAIFCLILLLLRVQKKARVSMDEVRSAQEAARQLLAQMHEIGATLEKNLEEKRNLTRDLFEELDQRTSEAGRILEAYRKIHRATDRSAPAGAERDQDASLGRKARSLMEKGMDLREAATHLGIPSGELELLLKLQAESGEG